MKKRSQSREEWLRTLRVHIVHTESLFGDKKLVEVTFYDPVKRVTVYALQMEFKGEEILLVERELAGDHRPL
jgi:hypothetical protein